MNLLNPYCVGLRLLKADKGGYERCKDKTNKREILSEWEQLADKTRLEEEEEDQEEEEEEEEDGEEKGF